jgi:hypothetical protein
MAIKAKIGKKEAIIIIIVVLVIILGVFLYSVLKEGVGDSKKGVLGDRILGDVLEATGVVSSCAPDKTLFKVSGSGNAHAGTTSGSSYTWSVCFEDYDVTKEGVPSRVCTGGEDVIIRLSGNTNAHAERDLGASAGYQNVCFDDTVSCSVQVGNTCSSGTTSVASLSGTTNAHIAGPGVYGNQLCCSYAPSCTNEAGCSAVGGPFCDTTNVDQIYSCVLGADGCFDRSLGQDCSVLVPAKSCVGGACVSCTTNANCNDNNECTTDTCNTGIGTCTNNPSTGQSCGIAGTCQGSPIACVEPCDLTDAYWNTTTVTDGDLVSLIAVGDANCAGKSVTYQIYEDEPINNVWQANITVIFGALTEWTAIWQDDGGGSDPEYFFKVMDDLTGDNEKSNTNLDVAPLSSPCTITNPRWNVTGLVEIGTRVKPLFDVTGDCAGKGIQINVWEDDNLVGDNQVYSRSWGVTDDHYWDATWEEDGSTGNALPEYYFWILDTDNGNSQIDHSSYNLNEQVVVNCASTCEPSTDGPTCSTTTSYQTCGDHNGDGCYEYGGTTSCTGADECQSGVCVTPPVCTPANVATDCASFGDSLECTVLECNSNVCENTPVTPGTSCNGGSGTCDSNGDCVSFSNCDEYSITDCANDPLVIADTDYCNDFAGLGCTISSCACVWDTGVDSCSTSVTQSCSGGLLTTCVYGETARVPDCANSGTITLTYGVVSGDPTECFPTTTVIDCAQIASLPFFTWINIVSTILILIFLYSLLRIDRRLV